ncbi:hypothetical protein [Saccharolobus solfataricus]|nr:hypothetical protein [Saccharolobus solfataricus]
MSNIRFWKNNRNYSFVKNSTTEERFKVRKPALSRGEFKVVTPGLPH